MLAVSIVLFIVLALLIIEARSLNRSVQTINNRIHINGTRGKSTVTGYISAAVHEDGSNTMAKITGVIPTLFHNGIAHTINRTGGARIQEQFNIIRTAARQNCNNLILECMSVDPGLQKIESKFFKPHIYIITNIRDDHRESMGSTIEKQVGAICEAIPSNCTVVTACDRHLEKITEAAKSKNSQLKVADLTLLDDIEERFSEGVFRENMAIALTVSKILNVDEKIAIQRIQKHINQEKPRLSTLEKERDILFLNGFDVNDTESADIFLNKWHAEKGEDRDIIALFNTRADRPVRTVLFSKWLVTVPNLKKVIISGNHHKRAACILGNAGVEKQNIIEINRKNIKNIKQDILNMAEDHTLVFSIGNVANEGFRILNELK